MGAARPASYDYAAFRALGETHAPPAGATGRRAGATARPLVATRADAIALGAEAARVDTHVVAQWAMQRQLASAAAAARSSLYLDLPVGVSCDAYEVWRHRELFLTELAAGAPPDALFLGGQNWGLPPLSPVALRRDRYRYFIRCVRHHMTVAGMLRIDHVMGLFRLYCVPAGPAGHRRRVPALPRPTSCSRSSRSSRTARSARSSARISARCPTQVRPAMARHGMFRLHVGQWFLPSARRRGTRTVAGRSRSPSLNTHDTATFAGWWRGADIDDRRDLGLITAEQEPRRARRARPPARRRCSRSPGRGLRRRSR